MSVLDRSLRLTVLAGFPLVLALGACSGNGTSGTQQAGGGGSAGGGGVTGSGWTSDISSYAATPAPITYDNVVYEVHGYPPATSSYTYANIPVIVGEYGSLTNSTSFYADLEAKQIPNLAWDFDPYSDCAPDLLSVTRSATSLTPSAWGSTVQSYLLAHAP